MGNDILQAIPTLEKDIPAEQFMVQEFWEPLAWTCAVILPLAVLAAWWLYRRRNKKEAAAITPMQEALAALSELHEETPPMRECSLRLSLILRSYLAGQTQDSSLFETHEEFSQRMDSLSGVPKSCQQETRDLLDYLADFKYSGNTMKDDGLANRLIAQARELVCRINEAQAAEAREKEETV